MLDYIYFGLYKFFSFLLWILPDFIIRGIMRGLAWFAYNISSKHRNIINSNLDLAFTPNLTAKRKRIIGLHVFMNLIDTIFGIIKRDGLSKEKVLANVTFEGREIIEKYKNSGKNFILITGHYGNWELLSQAIAIEFDLNLVGVGRALDSKLMHEVLKTNREKFNVEMVNKKGAMKGCIKAINQSKVIGILTDQAIRKNQSEDVEFFGVKATHTPLASILSRKFNLDMIPAYISTDDFINYRVKIYEPIETLKTDNQVKDIALLTKAQADIMQKVIEFNPKQWFWVHKRWKGFNNAEK